MEIDNGSSCSKLSFLLFIDHLRVKREDSDPTARMTLIRLCGYAG